MILPKPHLSFSQIQLWLSSKETYRKKYYADVPPTWGQTPAMAFGNTVTEAMERGEEWVKFIPRYSTFEYNPSDEPSDPNVKTLSIQGVPVMAFIDSMNLDTCQFAEQKTGVTPWTQNKVNKHFQLDIYSLLIQKEFGDVQDECFLIWVKTEKVKKKRIFDGHELEGREIIQLTGEYKMFPRVITQFDRDEMEKTIVKVGREIEEDYKAMKHLYQ